MDGWDEYFQYQTWLDAFAACGLDPDFYTVRGYGEEELLPWQTLSVGVDPGFLLRERRRAYEGLVTPDCRQAVSYTHLPPAALGACNAKPSAPSICRCPPFWRKSPVSSRLPTKHKEILAYAFIP